MPSLPRPDLRAALRVALGHQVLNGSSGALGLLLISAGVQLAAGPAAAGIASVGVIACIPPDRAAPQRGKFAQMLPAALLSLPLFVAAQALHAHPLLLGLLLVPGSFVAFLAGAWGARGLPIVVSLMFAMVFALAVPAPAAGGRALLANGLDFALGAALYLVWSTLSNAALNARYRVLVLAETLLALARLMRTQAAQLARGAAPAGDAGPLIGTLMRQQAALADLLQPARDVLLESPRTPRRVQLAGVLLQLIEMRDHLLACELDLDALQADPAQAGALAALGAELQGLAATLEAAADTLLLGRRRVAAPPDVPRSAGGEAPPLVASLRTRVGHLHAETARVIALVDGSATADLAAVRTAWQMFVSPTTWSWQPLLAAWRWDAPPLRHALRAALAIGTAYALALALPWGTHDYWILVTIVVVLRGSLAQTLERRNSRVAGTLLGCVLAAALLAAGPPHWALLLSVTLAQAVAHAFVVRQYLVTAVAATVLGLVQAHLLKAGASPAFDVLERIADTLLGTTIAWLFSYVLPSWERGQLPALVARTLAAQARHARLALGLGQLSAIDDAPELAWRLARREAHDSLSALVQSIQRSLAEPRAVRPPLAPLGRLLAQGYQLLAQLTAVKTLLLLRRAQLDTARLQVPLAEAGAAIDAALLGPPGPATARTPEADETAVPLAHGDPTPWALRRLALAGELAVALRADADAVRQALGPAQRDA